MSSAFRLGSRIASGLSALLSVMPGFDPASISNGDSGPKSFSGCLRPFDMDPGSVIPDSIRDRGDDPLLPSCRTRSGIQVKRQKRNRKQPSGNFPANLRPHDLDPGSESGVTEEARPGPRLGLRPDAKRGGGREPKRRRRIDAAAFGLQPTMISVFGICIAHPSGSARVPQCHGWPAQQQLSLPIDKVFRDFLHKKENPAILPDRGVRSSTSHGFPPLFSGPLKYGVEFI
jgi:hypothetical protein